MEYFNKSTLLKRIAQGLTGSPGDLNPESGDQVDQIPDAQPAYVDDLHKQADQAMAAQTGDSDDLTMWLVPVTGHVMVQAVDATGARNWVARTLSDLTENDDLVNDYGISLMLNTTGPGTEA